MTTIEETLTKMDSLRLTAMSAATRELLATSPGTQLDFPEMLGILVDRECVDFQELGTLEGAVFQKDSPFVGVSFSRGFPLCFSGAFPPWEG